MKGPIEYDFGSKLDEFSRNANLYLYFCSNFHKGFEGIIFLSEYNTSSSPTEKGYKKKYKVIKLVYMLHLDLKKFKYKHNKCSLEPPTLSLTHSSQRIGFLFIILSPAKWGLQRLLSIYCIFSSCGSQRTQNMFRVKPKVIREKYSWDVSICKSKYLLNRKPK